jgi:hypothetical protein
MNKPLAVALLLACPAAALHAQRLAPVGLSATHTVMALAGAAPDSSRSILPRSVAHDDAVSAPAASRGGNAGRGALIGAAVLGVTGAVLASRDQTGEGLLTPVVFIVGAALGAVLGALAGLAWPT